MSSQTRAGLTGRKSDIDATPSRLSTDLIRTVNEGVQILTSSSNTDAIYVGYSAAITADSADATDGFPLAPGAAMFLPCRHISDIWLRSESASSQVVWFLGQ